VELRLRRRRRPGVSSLHQDVRRLMALAHPMLQHDARETIACHYYIDALNDAEFALKVRERVPILHSTKRCESHCNWRRGSKMRNTPVMMCLRNRRYVVRIRQKVTTNS